MIERHKTILYSSFFLQDLFPLCNKIIVPPFGEPNYVYGNTTFLGNSETNKSVNVRLCADLHHGDGNVSCFLYNHRFICGLELGHWQTSKSKVRTRGWGWGAPLYTLQFLHVIRLHRLLLGNRYSLHLYLYVEQADNFRLLRFKTAVTIRFFSSLGKEWYLSSKPSCWERAPHRHTGLWSVQPQ